MDNSGSAFPHEGAGNPMDERGLTKREWFAGMAMQGLLQIVDRLILNEIADQGGAVKLSYKMADEMMKVSEQ